MNEFRYVVAADEATDFSAVELHRRQATSKATMTSETKRA
jgi:hypothetical protein